MSDQDAFEHVLASLYEATLDDAHWPAASARLDEACGLTGNSLAVGGDPAEELRALFPGFFSRGQRRTEIEREYLDTYYAIDERVPRMQQLPDSELVPVRDLYTAEEWKTSPVVNVAFPKWQFQDGLHVRMDGLAGTHMVWSLCDPVAGQGWGSAQLSVATRLLPHIRQFVCVRQALVRAGALQTTLTSLLENRGIGVVHLDRRGRVVAANDRARDILRAGDVLSDAGGFLSARSPNEQSRLEKLLAGALPADGAAAAGGSLLLRRANGLLPLVLHIKPVRVPQPDYGGRQAAALVLLAEPDRRGRIDPVLVAAALGLTPGEGEVAAGLAAGRRAGDMARDTGRTRDAIYWHLKQIYQKHQLSGQADLIRLVQSIAGLD